MRLLALYGERVLCQREFERLSQDAHIIESDPVRVSMHFERLACDCLDTTISISTQVLDLLIQVFNSSIEFNERLDA